MKADLSAIVGPSGRLYVNFWRHFRDDVPAGLTTDISEDEAAARADASPPLWFDGRGHSMKYLGTAIMERDGSTRFVDLALVQHVDMEESQ